MKKKTSIVHSTKYGVCSIHRPTSLKTTLFSLVINQQYCIRILTISGEKISPN